MTLTEQQVMELTEQQLAGIAQAQRILRRETLLKEARGLHGESARWIILRFAGGALIIGVLAVTRLLSLEVLGGSVAIMLFWHLHALDRRLEALVALAEQDDGASAPLPKKS